MKTEKIQLRIFLKIKALLFLFLLNAACSTGAPNYSKQFIFESGQKKLEIDVNKHCTYEIGISFLSPDNDQAVKEFFGHARQIHLPALVDIVLSDDSGKSLVSIEDFGGLISGYRYGPNPLKLIAGKIYLKPGKYTAVISIKNVGKDFSRFESSFFVSGDPKVTCAAK